MCGQAIGGPPRGCGRRDERRSACPAGAHRPITADRAWAGPGWACAPGVHGLAEAAPAPAARRSWGRRVARALAGGAAARRVAWRGGSSRRGGAGARACRGTWRAPAAVARARRAGNRNSNPPPRLAGRPPAAQRWARSRRQLQSSARWRPGGAWHQPGGTERRNAPMRCPSVMPSSRPSASPASWPALHQQGGARAPAGRCKQWS